MTPRTIFYAVILFLALLAELWVLSAAERHGEALVQAKWDKEHAAQLQSQLSTSETYRLQERAADHRTQELTHANQDQHQSAVAVERVLRSDADGLRGQLTATLASSAAAGDTLAACETRAGRAGQLLADGVQVQVRLAAAAESHAADAGTLFDWGMSLPRTTSPGEKQ